MTEKPKPDGIERLERWERECNRRRCIRCRHLDVGRNECLRYGYWIDPRSWVEQMRAIDCSSFEPQ